MPDEDMPAGGEGADDMDAGSGSVEGAEAASGETYPSESPSVESEKPQEDAKPARKQRAAKAEKPERHARPAKDESSLKSFKSLFEKQKTFFASAVIVALAFGFFIGWSLGANQPGGNGTGYVTAGSQTPAQIAQSGVDFLNEYFTQSGGVSLLSAQPDGDLINITTSYQGNDIPVYMTRDGRFVILDGIGAINIEDYKKEAAAQEAAAQQAPEVPKSDKPVANVFVMSYCPYGLQMEKAVIPVMELLGGKADIEINFVHYVMHGEKEADENTRQYCIEKEQPDKYVAYLSCFVQSDNTESCQTDVGIDKAQLASCIADAEATYNITGIFKASTDPYPPYPVDAALAQQYGVQGSPTFVLNGVTLQLNRSPEAVKEAICDAFISPPAECNQTLSTASEAAGIGPLGSGSASSGTTASCGS
jgi:protein-disulfide isomerase